MDLQLGPGTVRALVSGSELYRISIVIAPLSPRRWRALVRECAGQIGSLVELLQGQFSRAVMEMLIRRESGLFPSAREIAFECSCPDRVSMCKHVAATLYGVGARLDAEPELFFRLRRVDQLDLLAAASRGAALAAQARGTRKRIAGTALGEVFGIELDESPPAGSAHPAPASRTRRGRAPANAPIPRRRDPDRDPGARPAARLRGPLPIPRAAGRADPPRLPAPGVRRPATDRTPDAAALDRRGRPPQREPPPDAARPP